MIHAYDKSYLEEAMCNLGDLLDYIANDCHMDKAEFMKLFIASGLAAAFEQGVPRVIVGMSGAELAQEVMLRSGSQKKLPEASVRFGRNVDYWCGWILAYYQWESGQSFEQILSTIPIEEIERLYSTLHEAPEEKFAEIVRQRERMSEKPTHLKYFRTIAKLSQAELAKKSGVSLRSIQMYEQRQKDINKAQAITLYQLSRTIGCKIEDLLERSAYTGKNSGSI